MPYAEFSPQGAPGEASQSLLTGLDAGQSWMQRSQAMQIADFLGAHFRFQRRIPRRERVEGDELFEEAGDPLKARMAATRPLRVQVFEVFGAASRSVAEKEIMRRSIGIK